MYELETLGSSSLGEMRFFDLDQLHPTQYVMYVMLNVIWLFSYGAQKMAHICNFIDPHPMKPGI